MKRTEATGQQEPTPDAQLADLISKLLLPALRAGQLPVGLVSAVSVVAGPELVVSVSIRTGAS